VTGLSGEKQAGREHEVFHHRLDFAAARPSLAELVAVLGYAADKAPEPVRHAYDELLKETAEIWRIEGGCAIYPALEIDRKRHVIEARGVAFDVGRIVCQRLENAEELAVFVCTAGRGIEDLSRRLMSSNDPLMGYVADTLGSLVVEKAMDLVQERLAAALLERGLKITERYSPGYCGWNVAEQRKLFQLLPDGFCGVRLTESSLMQPIKSVSGFIGVGRNVERHAYDCHMCDIDDCLYRKRRA
jgi:hypothetical protein